MLIKGKKLKEVASRVKAVAMDVDGCLLPDVECLLPAEQVAKFRSRVDGQGVSLMRAIGLSVVFITAEKKGTPGFEPIKRLVDNWNRLPSSQINKGDNHWPMVELFGGKDTQSKGDILTAWLKEKKIKVEECAVMGDDLVDVPMLKIGGFKVAPVSAENTIKELADWVTDRPGGFGAVRDLANLLVSVKKIDPYSLPCK
ncbi:MAG TPA: HAD hydrolase family protein [Candidatus Paceibacterota bacterium]|nr:HAD hydrolase family protein [Candidatus Woesebacteria bacterium]HOY11387.1 HAD hydrolase family protein [Candidatus Paceibacterota bacterium]HPN89394.1 HAD hydrolase family protein [Candidatus Paceibacterota bacterium]HQB26823.1 HAD hydrolase family protein [Candidatus Paceibacterota bacterium]